jgi:hypothetical protein
MVQKSIFFELFLLFLKNRVFDAILRVLTASESVTGRAQCRFMTMFADCVPIGASKLAPCC